MLPSTTCVRVFVAGAVTHVGNLAVQGCKTVKVNLMQDYELACRQQCWSGCRV